MNEPTRYIHIGYPKCASTALQTHFFSKHPSLHHLGAGSGGTVAQYINAAVLNSIEVSLRIEKDAVFKLSDNRNVFEEQFTMAANKGKTAVGISSESLSFTMHHDIDPSQKAKRLFDIFGQNTRIIIVIREQWSLLKSLYREYVLGGLHLTYSEFISSIYYNQGRSCLFDLNFAYTHNLYEQLFGKNNILTIAFEDLRDSPRESLERLQRHIGIPVQLHSLPKENPKEDERLLESARRLNCVTRPNHARSVIEPIGAFRYPEYFEEKLGVPIPSFVMDDQRYIVRIRDLANPRKLPYATPPLNYDVDPIIEGKIESLLSQWNTDLSLLTGMDLNKLGYAVR